MGFLMSALVILGLLLPGCLPETRREAVPPRAEHTRPPISMSEVESIMARLARVLEDKRITGGDRQVAKDLLNSLDMMKSHLEPPVNRAEADRISRLLFEALDHLEKEYFARERADEGDYPKVLDAYASRRKQIIRAYLSGDHEGVINLCIGLQDAFGKAGLTPDVGLVFCLSLAKRGRISDALKVGEKVIGELEEGPDSLHLRARMIEWYLSLDQGKRARDSLEKLSRSTAEREALLKEARGRLGEQETAVASVPSPSPEADAQDSTGAQAFQSLDKLLAEVDGLIQRNELTKAKFLLLQQRIRFPEGPETEAIDQAMQKVEAAEMGPGEEIATTGFKGDGADGITLAKKLVEEEKYEEAISRLEEMEREGNATPDSRELKEAAIEKLINRERNRAAKLFLMAKGTSDPAKKNELLASSYNILKVLIDKYPSSPLISKINDNMNRIREEMELHKGRSG
ncbi:MAG: hypothetical protein AB1512_30940 [Thermodesulfobacteriota bacterium]